MCRGCLASTPSVSHWFSSLAHQVGKVHGRFGQAAVWLIMARCHTMHVAPIRPIITGCSSRAIGTESARCEPNYMQHSHSLFHIIQREIPLRWRKKRKNWSALSHTYSHIYIYIIISLKSMFVFSGRCNERVSEQKRNYRRACVMRDAENAHARMGLNIVLKLKLNAARVVGAAEKRWREDCFCGV